jgi:hypothetical protein
MLHEVVCAHLRVRCGANVCVCVGGGGGGFVAAVRAHFATPYHTGTCMSYGC